MEPLIRYELFTNLETDICRLSLDLNRGNRLYYSPYTETAFLLAQPSLESSFSCPLVRGVLWPLEMHRPP